MLHECLFHCQKSKNVQTPVVPLPVRSRDIRNRAAASKLARLIDPVVTLTRDWLICQPAKAPFSTEPNSHFIGRLHDPIHSSEKQNTRTPLFRQPPFLIFFHFPGNAPFSLMILHVFSAPERLFYASFRRRAATSGAAAASAPPEPQGRNVHSTLVWLAFSTCARMLSTVPARAFRPRHERMKSWLQY